MASSEGCSFSTHIDNEWCEMQCKPNFKLAFDAGAAMEYGGESK